MNNQEKWSTCKVNDDETFQDQEESIFSSATVMTCVTTTIPMVNMTSRYCVQMK